MRRRLVFLVKTCRSFLMANYLSRLGGLRAWPVLLVRVFISGWRARLNIGRMFKHCGMKVDGGLPACHLRTWLGTDG